MIFGKPKKLPDGRYYLKVTTDDESRVMYQLNKSKMVTKFDDSENVTIDLSDASAAVINAVDDEIIAAAKVNCLDWFGKNLAEKTLESALSRSVNKDNAMNVGKATVKGQVFTKVFNSQTKEPLDTSALDVDTYCDIMLEFSGVWFMKKTFGAIWRIAQARVLAPPKKLYPDEYLFQDSDEGAVSEEDTDYI
jgi:hypothetical protein